MFYQLSRILICLLFVFRYSESKQTILEINYLQIKNTLMKLRIIYTFFGLAFFVLLTMSNSSGRANASQEGATTAPGDGTTCTTCHSGGNFGASVSLQLFDKTTNMAITEYVPGTTYDVAVTISTTTAPAGFGFQAIAMKDSDDTSISSWANNATANTQVTDVGSRQYFEQSAIASDNVFEAEWTAPAASTGNVTFYFAGNAIDGTGSTANDQSVTNTVTFTESTVSTSGLAKLGISLDVFPNPTVESLTLTLNADEAKDLTINIYDLNGKQLHNEKVTAQNGNNRFQFDVATYTKGIYFVEITDGINRTATRFVKY